MAKMTAKYKGAIQKANGLHLPAWNTNNQEELYILLQDNGFFWNSDLKQWEEHPIEQAEEPTPLILVRVWANAETVDQAANDIVKKAPKQWQLIERSQPYLCRPPKQREARIYLKFLPK